VLSQTIADPRLRKRDGD